MLLEEYLDYLHESKWRRLLAQGKLTKTMLRRIQKYRGAPDQLYVKQLLKQGKHKQATQYLKSKGIVKPARLWLTGVEKGTQNILKKLGAKVLHKPDVTFAKTLAPTGLGKEIGVEVGKTMKKPFGSHSKTSLGGAKVRVHIPTGLKKKEHGLGVLIKRHEADEARAAAKQIKSKFAKGVAIPVGGGHLSSDVLRRERELVRIAKALYGKGGGGKQLSKFRRKSGEYEILKMGSRKKFLKHEAELRKSMIEFSKEQKREIAKLPPDERKMALKSIKDSFKSSLSTPDFKRAWATFYRA